MSNEIGFTLSKITTYEYFICIGEFSCFYSRKKTEITFLKITISIWKQNELKELIKYFVKSNYYISLKIKKTELKEEKRSLLNYLTK